jgi:hypothetical protein
MDNTQKIIAVMVTAIQHHKKPLDIALMEQAKHHVQGER